MGPDPLLPLVYRAGEGGDEVAVFLDIALFRKICRVGDLPGGIADCGNNVALALRLQHGGGRFKAGEIVACARREGCGHHGELHAAVKRQLRRGVDAVLAQRIFERHIRHAALAAGQNDLAPELLPVKGVVLFPCDKERAVAAGDLCEHLRVVGLALVVYIHRRLRAGKAYVHVAGQHRAHHRVGALSVGKVDVDTLLGKKAARDRHILRRIEHRVGDLAHAHLGLAARVAACRHGQQQNERQPRAQNTQKYFHQKASSMNVRSGVRQSAAKGRPPHT